MSTHPRSLKFPPLRIWVLLILMAVLLPLDRAGAVGQDVADEIFYHFMPICWRDSDGDSGDFLGQRHRHGPAGGGAVLSFTALDRHRSIEHAAAFDHPLNGRLDFGTWERIFYGEFDGRRRKRVLVKVIGE